MTHANARSRPHGLGTFPCNMPPLHAGDDGRSPFPPIASYGFLSDCETTALVAPSGNVEWLCLPRMDSPSVFGAILDRDAGTFAFGPEGVHVPADRRYLPGHDGARDELGRARRLDHRARHPADRPLAPRAGPLAYAPPGAHRLRLDHVLLRIVPCAVGEVQVTLDCDPAFDYGLRRGRWEYSGGGYHEATCRWPRATSR